MNKSIVISVVVITLGGVIRVWTGTGTPGTSLTRVFIGANILLLVLAVVDFFGGPLSTIAGALAFLAAVVVLLNDIPWGLLFGQAKAPEEKPAGLAALRPLAPAGQPGTNTITSGVVRS